jgi:hypothetical protein
MPTLHLLPTMMHLHAHGTPSANLEVLELMFPCTFKNLIPSLLTLCGPDKRFHFPHQLSNWCHDKGKVFYETSIKLSHTMKK